MTSDFVIARTDPREPAVRRLIDELDAYQAVLYPAESNYGLDLDEMSQPSMRFFSITVGGEVLGCGGYWRHDGYGEVKRLYVSPRSRGMGLGRKLMAHIEDAMWAEGLGVSRLETGVSQPEALGLYHAIGYEIREAFGDYPTDDPLSVFMEKRLG